MASITTSLGVGSGIDINGTVSQLTAAEGKPQLDAIAAKTAVSQTKLSGLGTLKGALSSFQTALKALQSNATFDAQRITSSDEKILKVSTTAGASATEHLVKVNTLAKAQKSVSTIEFTNTDVVSEGVIKFNDSKGEAKFSVTVTKGVNDSLTAFRDAINNAKDNNTVMASIINVDSVTTPGTTVSKLVLTSKATGVANSFTIDASLGDSRFNLNETESSLFNITKATDANLIIDATPLSATKQRSTAAAEFSENDTIGAGKIIFKDSTGTEKFSVDIIKGENDNLFAFVDEINKAAGNNDSGVIAKVINVPSATNPDTIISKLVFESKLAGKDKAFSIDASGGDTRLTLDSASPVNAQRLTTKTDFAETDLITPGKLVFKDATGTAKFSIDVVGDTIEKFDTGTVDPDTGEPIFEDKPISGTGNNSLTALRDAINFNPENKLVSASVVTTKVDAVFEINPDTGETVIGEDGKPVIATPEKTVSQLVFTALASGTNGGFSIDASEGDARLSTTTPENFTSTTTAANFSTVAPTDDGEVGQSVTRGSNTITDAIPGVSLSLQAAGESTIQSTADKEATLKPINDFVAAYNKLGATLKDLTKYVEPGSSQNGALLGDSTVQNIIFQLRQLTNGKVTSASGSYDSLGTLGVTFDKNGVMLIDSSKVETALASNTPAIASLFSSADGVATRLNAKITQHLDPKGSLSTQQNTLNKQLTQLSTEKLAVEKRLESTKKSLQQQFTAMDAAVSKFKSTGDFLTQSLNNNNSNNN